MQVFIVYAHPSKKSYTYQVLQALLKGLHQAGHQIEVSDLYQMKFRPEMTEEEYEREGFAKTNLPLPEDVLLEHQKIEKAATIIFLYPLWWSDCPAFLKGWFDRVYAVGYAYGYDAVGNKSRQMKKVNKGFVICTAGHPNDFLEKTGIARSLRNIMLDDRLGPRFKEKEMIILGGTLDMEKVRVKHLASIQKLGLELQ